MSRVGLARIWFHTRSDSSDAADWPKSAGMEVKAPRSSLTIICRVIPTTMPYVASWICSLLSAIEPRLNSPFSLTFSSWGASPRRRM